MRQILVAVLFIFSFAKEVYADCIIGEDTWVTAISNLKVDARWDESDKQSAKYDAPDGYVIVETQTVENSNHWGSASVTTLAGDSKFATSSDFSAANNYMLDVLGKYSNAESQKEFKGKLAQATSSKSSYSRTYESSHNAVYAEVDARGSGNFWDQQGGWMDISVRARLVCLGSPDRKELAAQLAKAAAVPTEDKIHRIIIQNNCNKTARVAVNFKNLSNHWITEYWWKIDPGERTAIRKSDYQIATANSVIYYYATAEGLIWAGKAENKDDIMLDIDNKMLMHKFRRVNGTEIHLDCSSAVTTK